MFTKIAKSLPEKVVVNIGKLAQLQSRKVSTLFINCYLKELQISVI